jgi:hypothetical protein
VFSRHSKEQQAGNQHAIGKNNKQRASPAAFNQSINIKPFTRRASAQPSPNKPQADSVPLGHTFSHRTTKTIFKVWFGSRFV